MNVYTNKPMMRTLYSDMEPPMLRTESKSRTRGRFSKDINRLMGAAAVSPRFCRQLLSDPMSALTAGYNGESFLLTPDEIRMVCSIQANTLRSFAAQLVDRVEEPVTEIRKAWAPKPEAAYPLAYEHARVRISDNPPQ